MTKRRGDIQKLIIELQAEDKQLAIDEYMSTVAVDPKASAEAVISDWADIVVEPELCVIQALTEDNDANNYWHPNTVEVTLTLDHTRRYHSISKEDISMIEAILLKRTSFEWSVELVKVDDNESAGCPYRIHAMYHKEVVSFSDSDSDSESESESQ